MSNRLIRRVKRFIWWDYFPIASIAWNFFFIYFCAIAWKATDNPLFWQLSILFGVCFFVSVFLATRG